MQKILRERCARVEFVSATSCKAFSVLNGMKSASNLSEIFYEPKTPQKMSQKLKIFLICALALAGTFTIAEAQQRRGNANDSSRAESRRESVTLRCAYWNRTRPADGKEVELFIKDGRDYKPFQISEMAFIRAYDYRGPVPIPIFRKATEAEIRQREEAGEKKADREYVPCASIDTKGIRDVGVLIVGDISSRTLAFDLSEKAFPHGSLRIVNMAGIPIAGRFGAPEDKKKEVFRIDAANTIYTTKGVEGREIKDIMLAHIDPNSQNGGRVIFSSSAAFSPEKRSIIFLARSPQKQGESKIPKIEIRQITVFPLPPKPEEDPAANGGNASGQRGNNAKKPAKSDNRPPKPAPRRV